MIEWASPWWFLLLPVALLAPWFSRSPRVLLPSLAAVTQGRSWRVIAAPLPTLLASLGLAALVVALARPQLVNREKVVEREGIDIQLVLDTSGSMEAEDYRLGGRRTSRLSVAKEVLARFVEGRPDDRLGLVVFGEEAFTQVPLTTDQQSLVRFLGQVQIGMAGERATAVGDAIAVAARRLKDLDAPSKIIVLLTDGRSNAGQIAPLDAADAAAALDITIYTVGVGSADGGRGGGIFGSFSRGKADLDEKTLREIAARTEGRYFRAADTAALAEVYETIDQLERTTAEITEFVRTEERFLPWLAWGAILLALSALLSETALRRVP